MVDSNVGVSLPGSSAFVSAVHGKGLGAGRPLKFASVLTSSERVGESTGRVEKVGVERSTGAERVGTAHCNRNQ